MPKVKLTLPLEEIHGTLFDLVFKKTPKGDIIATKKPDMSRVKWSTAQEANRNRMSNALTLAQIAFRDPKVKAKYERKAKKQGGRAWNLALSDAMHGKDPRSTR